MENEQLQQEEQQTQDTGLTQEKLDEILTARLSRQSEQHQKELDELKQSYEQKIEDAVNRATLKDDELKAFEDAKIKKDLEAKQAEIDRLQKEITTRDMRDKAIATLKEKNIPVTDDVLKFVVKNTAEETVDAIETMANIYSHQRNEQAKSEPPLGGGGSSFQQSLSDNYSDITRKAKITGF